MDDIDAIILKSLKEVGCEIEDEIVNLSTFSPELVVGTVSKCLRIINPSLLVPKSLPPNVTQRYSVASSLVKACVSTGYNGEIGYHTFLYSNVPEIRKLYMFLVEMLPKEIFEKYDCKRFTLINLQVKNAYSITWIPSFCKTQMQKRIEDNMITSKARISYWIKKSSSSAFGINNFCTSPIIIINCKSNKAELLQQWEKLEKSYLTVALNKTKSHVKDALMKHKSFCELNAKKDILPIKKQNESLKHNMNERKLFLKNCFSTQKGIGKKIGEMQNLCGLQENTISHLKYEKKTLQRVYIILDDHIENINRMKLLIDATKIKKQKLISGWNDSRVPILQALETLELNKSSSARSISVRKNLRSIHKQSVKIKEDIQVRNISCSLFSQKLKELDACSHRKTYISRIMEIIDNIRKQNNDLNKVVNDTREVKKRITTISGILDRQFTVTDDALYSMAKRNDYAKKAYKLLAALHLYCSELIMFVQRTGSILREIRELEESVDQEKLKNVSSNLRRVKYDLCKIEKGKDLSINKMKC